MKILVVADIHGNFELASEILGKIKTDYDIMIAPGDFTDIFNVPPGFSQVNIADMVLQKLLAMGKPAFCIPGNHDPYEILGIFDEYNVNLHNQVREFKNKKFLGWGGAPTPFETPFEPEEEEARDTLKELGKQVETCNFILVVHNPPKNTKLDKIVTGEHVGSPEIRKFIEARQPVLAISAHIHESTGEDKIGKTTLFYPGPLFNGNYGIIHLTSKGVKTEIKKIDI
jgi:hypothetical protein